MKFSGGRVVSNNEMISVKIGNGHNSPELMNEHVFFFLLEYFFSLLHFVICHKFVSQSMIFKKCSRRKLSEKKNKRRRRERREGEKIIILII